MKTNDLVWLVGGEAGYGIQSAGRYFAEACVAAGLNIFGNSEYPSLIRGGHNFDSVRVGAKPVYIHRDRVDLILAINQETVDLHVGKLNEGGGVIYDPDEVSLPDGVRDFPVRLKALAMEHGKALIFRNTVGVGATFAALGLDLKFYEEVLRKVFARKGEAVVEANLAAARAGFKAIAAAEFEWKLEATSVETGRIVTGNDVICEGAVKAGVSFVAEYPMTPTSSILHYMAREGMSGDVVVKHAEDEVAAMNMVVGASWVGARAMTATSGGGFCLMVEALGMAGMIETPCVIVLGQRPGPSTGLPTRTEQGDLKFALSASQGDFPRIVLAPGSAEESYKMSYDAFNLADRYQMPVILITDKHQAEGIVNVGELPAVDAIDRGELITEAEEVTRMKDEGYQSPDDGFLRYKFSESGVSPRVLPGVAGGFYRSSTDEHDESGDLSEDPENRTKMMAKRMKKMETALENCPKPILHSDVKNPQATILCWGSTLPALLEACEDLPVNILQIRSLLPLHIEEIRSMLSKLVIGVEMNYSGQLCDLIQEKCGVAVSERILNCSGRQFTADELREKITSMLNE